MADWRELYKATVLETNPTQLEQLTKELFSCVCDNSPGLQIAKKNAARWQKRRRHCGL